MFRFVSALDHCGSVIVIANEKGEIEYVNPMFTKLTGYEKEEVMGQSPRIFQTLNSSEVLFEQIWGELLKGGEWHGEIENLRKDGAAYWGLLDVRPFRDADGNVAGFIGSMEDITNFKKLQFELEEKNRETNELLFELKDAQQKMIQQEKLAGIGQLAAGVSHEINNPLGYVLSNFETFKKYTNRITGMLECTIEKNESDSCTKEMEKMRFILTEIPEMVEDIRIGLARIQEIVQSLRLFSTSGNEDYRETYDLNDGIRNVLNIAFGEFRECCSIRLELADIPMIYVNPESMNQVLLNIVVNAGQVLNECKENEEGLLRIRTSQQKETVEILFEDNGPGIPRDIREKVFLPFFTTKPIGRGTGMGLSVVFDVIVNKHGGEIIIDESDLGGALIKIVLPVKGNTR